MTRALPAVLLMACGPIYPQPSAQQAPPAPQPSSQQGPPGMPADPYAQPQQLPSAPPQPAPPPPPQRPQGPQPALSSDTQQLLDAHNAARAKHCAAPLTWSPKLAAAASRWATQLRDRDCAFEHSPNNQFGENLAGGTSGYLDPSGVVAMWYGEVAKYDFQHPGFSMSAGHFTQVVWRGTTQVGCARSTCTKQNQDIWVCEYDPAGNWEGQYPQNVYPAGCK